MLVVWGVLQLFHRVPAFFERWPADALQVTSIAVRIAEVLDPQDYPTDHALVARGQALREHTQILSFPDRYGEALQYVAPAEQVFSLTPIEELEIARLAVVKACALRMQNRSDEAIALCRQAAEAFRDYGEHGRYGNARIVEAALLYDGGAIEKALELWTSMQRKPRVGEVGAVRVAHNIALCFCDLGRHAEAVAPLERCASDFRVPRLGYGAHAQPLAPRQRPFSDGAEPRRDRPAARCAARVHGVGMPVDAALAALDLSEALVGGWRAVRSARDLP